MAATTSSAASGSKSKTGQRLSVSVARELPSADFPEALTSYLHHDLDHPMSLFCVINKMRDNDTLCDISLRVGNSVTNAHRLVLASSSPYFYAMFNADMAERSLPEVELHDIDSGSLQLLIEFAYTSRVIITEDNVQNLLPASSFLQVDSVRDACCTFLKQKLRPNNCLGTWRFAETHSCNELSAQSRGYALQNFEAVAKGEEFLGLSFSDVEDLVCDDKLCVLSEDQVFVAVMKWINHDAAERSRCVARLMGHMRLAQMSKVFLFDMVYKDPLVSNDPTCKDLLLDTMMYRQFPERRSEFSTKLTERRTGGLVPYVFSVGGIIGSTITNSGECYNPGNDQWLPIAPMAECRTYAGVVSLDKLIYAVGGFNGCSYLSTVECYDSIDNKWSPMAQLCAKRSEMGIGTLDGLVYICGGFDGSTGVGTVERYDPLIGVWATCPGMNDSRVDCRVAVADNCVYAMGGRHETNSLATAERYDPRMSKWMTIADMNVSRISFSAASLDGMVYSVGGSNMGQYQCLSSGERFNARRNAWEPIANMHCCRQDHGMVPVDGGLLVLGGYENGTANPLLNSTERYDPLINQWTMATPMTTCRRELGATLLYCRNMDSKLTSDAKNTQLLRLRDELLRYIM